MSTPFKSVGVLTTDRDLVVTSWDRWLIDATGTSAESACGRSLHDLVPDLEKRGFLARLRRVLDQGTVEVLAPAFHHYLIPCAPSEPSAHFEVMQQHVIISPLRNGEEVIGAVLTIEDVTPRLHRERELAAQLRSGDEAIRSRAARSLAESSAHDVLVEAFGDPQWQVRRAAAEGFRVANADEAVTALTEALRHQHRDFSVLNATLSALAVAGGDVLPALTDALASEDADLRTYAALALGQLDDDRTVEALLSALADPEANVRYHVIEALGRRRAAAAADRLAEIALSGDFFLAFGALDALARIGESSVAPRLLHLLDDRTLSSAAVEALGAIGAEEAVGPIAALLERSDTEVPVRTIVAALVSLHTRFEEAYGEGELIADLARTTIGAAGAQRLVAALPEATDQELGQLALVIGWLEFPGVTRVLAGLLAHPEARQPAVDALVRHGGASVAVLMEELRSATPEVSKSAAAALGRIGSPYAVPALAELLGSTPELAVVAASALGSIGDETAFEPLLPLLADEQSSVRQAAAAALNSLGHRDMLSRVRPMLQDESPRLRESGARIAGYFGYDECLDAMIGLCSDPDLGVRRVAIEHMAYFRNGRAKGAVIAALQDPAGAARAAAARALAHVEGPDTLDALAHALRDPDPWVRYYAARSSASHPVPELVDALCAQALTDPAPPARIAAVEALGHLGDGRAVETLAKVALEDEPEIAGAALGSMGKIGAREAVPHLLEALRDPRSSQQLAALQALGRSRLAGDVVEEVRLVAASAPPEVTRAATEALVQAGTADAVRALIGLAHDANRRTTSVAALARVREDLLDTVGEGLRHEDREVRAAVVEALARRKHARATRLLATALGDSESKVRLAAERALGRTDLRTAELRSKTMGDPSGARRPNRDALVR